MRIIRPQLDDLETWPYLRPVLVLPAVGLLALLVRLIYLVQLNGSPLFDLRMGDAEVYHAWAKQIAGGDWMGKEVFYQAPLYPYFLGVWYSMAGTDPWGLYVAQALLGTASCVLLAAAGYRFFSPRVGLIGGVMLALYPSAIYFDGLVQKTVLDNFFLTLMLFLLSCLSLRPDGRRGVILWLLTGLSLACLALTRENALVLAVVVVVWLVVYFRDRPWRNRAGWAALLIVGMAVLLGPVAWRNHRVGGGYQLTTSQLGTNFFIGNNPYATGSYLPLRAGHGNAIYERRDATELAEKASGKTLTPAEVSSFWTGRATAYIREQPTQWLGLMGKKLWLTWNADELGDTDDQYFSARWSWLLRGLTTVFHFGVICPLAALGIVLWRDRRRVWLLYVVLAVYSLSVAAFFVFARYRYPLAPVVILFAAAGLVQVVESIRGRAFLRLGVAAAVAAAVAVTVNWRSTIPDDDGQTILYNIAVDRIEKGQLEEAARYSDWLLRQYPNHAGGHNTLGRVYAAQGKAEAAVKEFKAAIDAEPGWADPHNNLGNAWVSLGQPENAARHFHLALDLDPNIAEARSGLGVALTQQNRLDEAVVEFRRAIRLKPEILQAHNGLGIVLVQQGKLQEAGEEFRKVLELNPRFPEAHNGLGIVLWRQGRLDEAAEHLRKAIDLKPDFVEAQNNYRELQGVRQQRGPGR